MQRMIPSLTRSITLGAIACAGSIALAAADSSGVVDFGEFKQPADGGTFVQINVPKALINLAARIVEKDEPQIGSLLAGLDAVRVNVLELDDSNRDELTQRAESVKSDLAGRGWNHVVHVREDGEHVDVFVKMADDDIIAGVAITVLDRGGEAVFVNVVGNVRPDQLIELGERLNIEPLKHLPEHIEHS